MSDELPFDIDEEIARIQDIRDELQDKFNRCKKYVGNNRGSTGANAGRGVIESGRYLLLLHELKKEQRKPKGP